MRLEGCQWAAHLARDTRIRQPPENFCVDRFCISGSKPRPAKMRRALASAAAAPVARNSSYTWEEGKRIHVQRAQEPESEPVSPAPSPLPFLASQQLCHPLAPAVPEVVAPLPAALCAWCRLEELPARLAFRLLPPLGVGGEVRLLKDESCFSVLKRIPCSTSFPVLLSLASNSQSPT